MPWASIAGVFTSLFSAAVKWAGIFFAYLSGRRSVQKAVEKDRADANERMLDAGVNAERDPRRLAERLRAGGQF